MSAVEKLAREILDTRRLALGHATAPQLGYGSIDGGRIDFRTPEGHPIAGLGAGDDGGFEIIYVDGPKPATPTAPTVTADSGLFRVEWDGSFVTTEGEATLPTSDLDRVEVHASMDENFVPDRVLSFAGAFSSLDGGSFVFGPLPEAGTYYFRLVSRSKSKQFSAPSERVEQELAIASMDLAVTDAWLKGEAAQTTADGKNSIFRGPDEPDPEVDGPFEDGDIWFEMVEDEEGGMKSIPNIWDEDLGKWVANDDYRQSEIEKVQQELRDDLDAIVVDGSGTMNYYQGTPPDASSSPPPKEGDLWFDVSDQNKPYIYQDGEWITVRDSFAQPGAAAEIAGVSLPNAMQNQWSNVPGFSYTAQALKAEVPAGAPSGGARLVVPFQGTVDDSGVPVIAGSTIPPQGLPAGVSGEIFVNSPDADPAAKLYFRLEGGPWPNGVDIPFDFIVEPYTIGGSTHRLVWDAANDAALSAYAPLVDSIGFALEVNVSSTEGSFVDFNTGDRFTGRLQVPGPGVANEAITTEKIAAGAITAESGIIGSINAGTITVGEMDGARIKAGTVDADTVLIESSIGSTLIKDGAILTDHIAAGAITAESGIIGSIDANVITSGKIMANQLDADAINGKTIVGANILTRTSGNRVEIDNGGLSVYNSLGAEVVKMRNGSIDVKGGSLTGSTIRTSATGARIEMTETGLKQYDADGEVTLDLAGGSLVMNGGYMLASGFGAGSGYVRRRPDGKPNGVRITTGTSISESGTIETYNDDGDIMFEVRPVNDYMAINAPTRVNGDLTVQSGSITVEDSSTTNTAVDLHIARDSTGRPAIVAESPYWSGSTGSTSITYETGLNNGMVLYAPSMSSKDVYGMMRVSHNQAYFGMGGNDAGDVGRIIADKDTLYLEGDRVKSYTVYSTTGAKDRSVYVNSTGSLGVQGSSRRYKRDIEPATVSPDILDIDLKHYRYKSDVEEYEAACEYIAKIGEGPLPKEMAETPFEPEPMLGAIAEEVHDLGVTDLVQYDVYGRPDGLAYEKFGLALIPIVREQRDRINELESRLQALEDA